VALSGVFSFGGQYFFNHGFKRTSVALASLISLTTPVLAVLSGWIWLDEALTPHFLAGTLLILSAVMLQGMVERQKIEENA
jgi:drug/metabolite transporter (DMT)-like permease